MKKILTLLSVLVVAMSLSMPVFARGGSQEAPAQQTAPKKHVKKHHKMAKTKKASKVKKTKKASKVKKTKKQKKSKKEAPPAK